MGLLDWLTEGTGIGGGGMPPMNPAGDSGGSGLPYPTPSPASTQPMPPPQMTGTDAPFPPGADPMAAGGDVPNGPGLPYAPGSDPMTAGGAPPNGPGLSPPQVPMPMERPPNLGAGPAALPPAAMPTSGTGMPPGPPTSLAPAIPGDSLLPGQTALGRALGLDPRSNSFKEGVSGLGAGLTAAGNSRGKSPFQALASGAGATIEGSDKRADKTTEQQSKYLKDAIAAAQSGNTNALNIARTRLALAQTKTEEAKDGKPDKASVMNSQEQLYLRGLGAVNQDPKVKASLAQLRSTQAQFGPDSKEAKAAMTAHNDLIDGAKKQVFATLGVNEKAAAKIGKQAGFAADNPVPAAGLTKEKFDQLPVGAYFINPKDQRLLIKQPPAGANPTAPAQSPAPAASPVPVTAPAGSAADREDDE